MSQRSWQIGRPDLNAFFFFFFFPLSSRRIRFESFTALKYGTWFIDEQDTRQNTELKKSVVQSVSLCLSYLFLYILTSKLIKKLEKKLSKQKKKNLNLEFRWIKRAPKNKCARQLWDIRFIFFSLIWCTNLANRWRESPWFQVANNDSSLFPGTPPLFEAFSYLHDPHVLISLALVLVLSKLKFVALGQC